MKKLFNEKKAELNDQRILELLKKLPGMYENGELIEVQTICQEIANAIDDFSKC